MQSMARIQAQANELVTAARSVLRQYQTLQRDNAALVLQNRQLSYKLALIEVELAAALAPKPRKSVRKVASDTTQKALEVVRAARRKVAVSNVEKDSLVDV